MSLCSGEGTGMGGRGDGAPWKARKPFAECQGQRHVAVGATCIWKRKNWRMGRISCSP